MTRVPVFVGSDTFIRSSALKPPNTKLLLPTATARPEPLGTTDVPPIELSLTPDSTVIAAGLETSAVAKPPVPPLLAPM